MGQLKETGNVYDKRMDLLFYERENYSMQLLPICHDAAQMNRSEQLFKGNGSLVSEGANNHKFITPSTQPPFS